MLMGLQILLLKFFMEIAYKRSFQDCWISKCTKHQPDSSISIFSFTSSKINFKKNFSLEWD